MNTKVCDRPSSKMLGGRIPVVFVCSGAIGLMVSVAGVVTLTLGLSTQKHDYRYVVAGSICLGLGIIMTIMTLFLGLIWTKLNDCDNDTECQPDGRHLHDSEDDNYDSMDKRSRRSKNYRT